MSPGGAVPEGAPPPPMPHEAFQVTTSDDVQIRGWFIPAAEHAQSSIVICHGVGANHWGAEGLAETLHQASNFHVVLFDFRGHGLSEPAPYTYGAHEVRDVKAIVDWTRARTGRLPVSVVGWSAGAATALLYASRDPELRAIVAINSFADMADMASRRRPFFVREGIYEEALRLAEHRADFQISDGSPVRAAPRIAVPALLIVGEADATIPPDHTRRIHAALPGAQLWSLPGIGHDDWWRAPDFGERLIAFLDAPRPPLRAPE